MSADVFKRDLPGADADPLDVDTRPNVYAVTRPGALAEPAAVRSRAVRGTATINVSSDVLFGGAAELQISHRGAVYRLKQTALGKLILTK